MSGTKLSSWRNISSHYKGGRKKKLNKWWVRFSLFLLIRRMRWISSIYHESFLWLRTFLFQCMSFASTCSKTYYDGICFTVEILDHGEQVRYVHWQSFYVASKFYVFSFEVMKYEVSPVSIQFILIGMFCLFAGNTME